jgi:hypothetical protein
LTISKSDVSKTGSIAASWFLYTVYDNSDFPSIPAGSIRILANSGGISTTGAGNLGTVTGTATDGTVDTEIISVTVTTVTTGITLTPAAMTPVVCSVCLVWDDVLAKYNAYIGDTETWANVIACYTAYVGTR